jgi:hypothetical protein
LLKRWIEYRFTTCQAKDNWDPLQIDHILPINAFSFFRSKTDKHVYFHWQILQPLPSKETGPKSDKIILHQILYQYSFSTSIQSNFKE